MNIQTVQAGTLYRAKWTQATREEHKKNGGYFAGPNETFPLKDASDVEDAWGLAGHADNPDEIRRNVIAWAKENGHADALPDTAKEFGKGSKQDRSVAASTPTPATSDNAPHPPMTGRHSHGHDHMDGYGHEHEHEHNNDNVHDHAHTHAQHRAAPTTTDDRISMYAPITRIDKDEWVIEGQATSDAIDSYGTIFDYESSKKAFEKWRGNIREMHKNEAVGRAIQVIPDDENRCIFLRARISRGSRDTWEKILDGTLSGFSISVPPGRFKTKNVERNGKLVPMYYDHELAEVSVVDNPGSPNCDFAIVRADGLTTDILDTTEETTPSPTSSPLARAGARVSSDTRDAMHKGIAHTLHAAVAQMQNCGCDSCMKAQKMIDPDGDGDIDIGSFDDPDQDANDLYNGRDADMERSITAIVERVLGQQLSPIFARFQGIAGALARSNASSHTTDPEAITRAMESSFASVRAELSAVKEQVDHIANTPVPGAPIMNAGAIPKPVDKRLPTDPYQPPQRSGSSVYDAIARMSESGMLDTPERQTDAIAAGLMAQRRGI